MSYLRPDEVASQSQIRKNKETDESVKKGVKTAVGVGTALVGGALAGRIAPFLSEFIPSDLAMKGINKVSPKLGSFLQKGMAQGLSIQSGLDFIKEGMGMGEKKQEKAPDQRNIIEQYSPGLFTFLSSMLGKGVPLLKAAQEAAKVSQYKEAINKMEKDHKVGFNEILSSIFGGGQEAEKQPAQGMNQTGALSPQPNPPTGSNSIKSMKEEGGGQPQQGKPEPGQERVLAALQRLQQAREVK